MLNRSKNSNNYNVLKNLISQSRSFHIPHDAQYIIIYAFVYKFCSDSLKDHFSLLLQEKGITLKEAYNDIEYSSEFKMDAFKLYGYFIETADAFFDEIMDNKFNEKTFLNDFIEVFSKNISFKSKSNEEMYMDILFNSLSTDFNTQTTLFIKEIIYHISQLDIFETEFSYCDVFDAISDSRLLDVKSNHEYVYQILSVVLETKKDKLTNIYDPFMGNGESFLNTSNASDLWSCISYGKEEDKLTYCYTIARLLLNYYDLESVFVENSDATESIDFNQTSFDAIMSVIPITIRNYHTTNKNLSLEIAKRNKRAQLEEVLASKFDMNSDLLSQDSELNNVLEKLVSKMDVEADTSSHFIGEYEELNDSEFLFLINLIDSLKYDGIMTISISENFLFKPSLKILRKYLTFEKNYIDAIINIPNEFGRYKRPEVVIVFRKNRSDEDILFIDMSRNFNTVKGNSVVSGLFRRNLLLSEDTLNKLNHALLNREKIPKYSELIAMAKIMNNDFNLSVSKYVDTFEGKFVRLDNLVSQKAEIDKKREELTRKIDSMMDDLNIKF